MKPLIITILVVIAIFLYASITFADIARIDGGILYGSLQVSGGPQHHAYNEPLVYMPLDGEIHWAGLRWGLELGCGKSGQFDLFQAASRVGLEYNVLDYKLKILGRYQCFRVMDNTTSPVAHVFSGLALEVGGEWKISEMLNFHAVTVIPATYAYSRNGSLVSDRGIGQKYLKIGVQITQLPLFHVNLDYYRTGSDYAGEDLNISGEGFMIGVMVKF